MARFAASVLAVLLLAPVSPPAGDGVPAGKLDVALRHRPRMSQGVARVIIQTDDRAAVARLVAASGGKIGRQLSGMRAVVATVPESALEGIARDRSVGAVSLDRRLHGSLERTAMAIGARWVNENLGVDGTGVGVAIVDSGVARAHDDLGSRVVQFVDFVDFQTVPHDGYGHGTHVAGIIAGNGFDSDGVRRGVAPGAHLVVLKALDDQGDGYISNAIAAMDYAIEHREVYNIRVINLSVAAGVYESYKTDPLTLAARRAVEAGIVVVTAAGNLGRNGKGQGQLGGITSPGNAPWVLTVGAANHNGTPDRRDDTIAPFSSVGPSAIDLVAKPDLVAPGVGIESLADAGSTLFAARRSARLWGTVPTATQPYLSLSGTSMAAPVVAATVALILQANPALSPDAVKAVLQASAQPLADYSRLAQGAGVLDARGAVELARAFGDNVEAAALLEDTIDDAAIEQSAWSPSCGAPDRDCTLSTEQCFGAASTCFQQRLTVAGVSAPPAETVVWATTTSARPVRRRPRLTGKMAETGRTLGSSK